MGPFSLKLSQLPSGMQCKDPTDEDTIYLNHRTWKNQAGIDLDFHPYWLSLIELEDNMYTTEKEK